jgi:PmbA protein
LISAISGGNLYRKSSFLLDSLGKQVASPLLNILEEPHLKRGLASSPFDSEGVATHPRQLVKDGVLQGYVLGSYSARKLGMQTTGNAGGNHNLIVQSGTQDFAGLLEKMGTGLLVTELLGSGINMVTGDYSRGAAGFWVENGVIVHAVEEITIASNMADMLKGIVAIGNDICIQGSKQVGSILIERMTVASE